jgi:hypothetical protein
MIASLIVYVFLKIRCVLAPKVLKVVSGSAGMAGRVQRKEIGVGPSLPVHC